MNHTPGPWKVKEGARFVFIIGGKEEEAIAALYYSSKQTANARLIVRAGNSYHELLEACRDLLDAFWDMSPLQYAQSRGLPFMSDEEGERIKERARKAIAKADD